MLREKKAGAEEIPAFPLNPVAAAFLKSRTWLFVPSMSEVNRTKGARWLE